MIYNVNVVIMGCKDVWTCRQTGMFEGTSLDEMQNYGMLIYSLPIFVNVA